MRHTILTKAVALVLAVFSLLFFGMFWLLYDTSVGMAKQQALQNAATRLEMLCTYLDLALGSVRNTSYALYQSGLLMSSDEEAIQAYFKKYSEINSLSSVKMLLEGDRVVAIDNPLLLTSLSVNTSLYAGMSVKNRMVLTKPYYSPLVAGRAVALIRSVVDTASGLERLLVVEMRPQAFISLMTEKLSGEETVLLLTPEGETVFMNYYSSVLGGLTGTDGQFDITPELREHLTGMATGAHEVSVHGKDLLVIRKHYSDQWNVYYLISAEQFYQSIRASEQRLWLLFALGAGALVCSALFIGAGITRPVKRLSARVDKLPTSALLPVSGKDEVGRLAASFNNLLLRLRAANEEKEAIQRQHYELEYRVLQSQIQPHFLYNAHMCVSSLLEQGDTASAQHLLSDLDTLLRASTDKKHEIITLEEELDLTARYIAIQRIRYGERFEAAIGDFTPYKTARVPKLLLQPIVENAIYHGLPRDGRKGEIIIAFDAPDELLHITVTDNGDGIPRKRLAELDAQNEREAKNGMVSIGLTNVRRRIEHMYGKRCGMYIRSREGIGTTVELVIDVNIGIVSDNTG